MDFTSLAKNAKRGHRNNDRKKKAQSQKGYSKTELQRLILVCFVFSAAMSKSYCTAFVIYSGECLIV